MKRCNLILWVCVLAAAALIAWGFLMPPPGEIHESVLIGAGELLLFGVCAAAGFRADRRRDDY